MKAISVIQPYAELIALGEKTIEARSWRTHYRGPLAIQASKTLIKDGRPADDDMVRGAVVCVVDLVDCPRAVSDADVKAAMSDIYAESDWLWILAGPHRSAAQSSPRSCSAHTDSRGRVCNLHPVRQEYP